MFVFPGKLSRKIVGMLYALSTSHTKSEDRDAKIHEYSSFSKDADNSHAKGRALRTEG